MGAEPSTYKTMDEANQETCNIRSIVEQTEGHKWVTRESLLAVYEQKGHERTKDNEADDLWRVPRECHASKVKAEQQHQRETQNRKTTKPINGLDTLNDIGPRVVHVQEYQQQQKGCP